MMFRMMISIFKMRMIYGIQDNDSFYEDDDDDDVFKASVYDGNQKKIASVDDNDISNTAIIKFKMVRMILASMIMIVAFKVTTKMMMMRVMMLFRMMKIVFLLVIVISMLLDGINNDDYGAQDDDNDINDQDKDVHDDDNHKDSIIAVILLLKTRN